MKSKLFILLLFCFGCTTAQPYREFKWKDSTGTGSIHVAVPMIPGSQMVITGTVNDPTVILWNDTLLYIASKNFVAGVYATIANLALKKDKNDSANATGFARNWQLGRYVLYSDSSTKYLPYWFGGKYVLYSDSSTKYIPYWWNGKYYLKSDTNDVAKGFYSRAMVSALIAEAVLASGSGTVTSVATGNGLTGGPITITGTVKIDTTIKATAALTGFLGFADFSSFALAATRASKFAVDSSLYLQMDDTTAANGILSKTRGDNQYEVKGIAVLKATMPTVIGIACSDETTALTNSTSVAKVTFRVPYAMTVTAVRASTTTAPTGSTILVDIHENGTTILSTKIMIDANEFTSTTAATPYVLSDTALADDSEITVFADQVGSTIAGAGLKIWIIGTRIAP
jgi:hypothetical protein